VHVVDDYVEEQEISLGTSENIGKLYRIESDPVMPSMHDKERLVYYPQYMVIGNVSGMNPIFKYGKRLEFFTDLLGIEIGNKSLKDIVDDICNLMDAYVTVRPENVIETDVKDLAGRSEIFLTLSDDDAYGDIQISKVEEYVQGINNFKRISIDWQHLLMEGGQELVGAPGILNVNEFNYSSDLVNNSILAKNIATYIFGKMYSSNLLVVTTEYAPFLRVNMNVDVNAVGSNLYLGNEKEFKIVGIEHSWDSKETKLVLAERNIVFESLEI
jgi:hypothetical protein